MQDERCTKALSDLNERLAKECSTKVNTLSPCKEKESTCPCSSSSGSSQGEVDLVLLIDSSGSMRSAAAAVNAAADIALEKAKEECDAEVRTTWLWVDSIKPGSNASHSLGNAGNFTQSHQQYLESLGITGPFFHDLPDDPHESYDQEQGADAIADISKYFDWTPGACRSIFYISDTALEGVRSNAISNDLAKDQAISVAKKNNVTVFAHKIGMGIGAANMSLAEIYEDYNELCSATGGEARTGGDPSEELYIELITLAICNCGGGCIELEVPDIKPCITVTWGDSECDSFETDDLEKVCITICNCYSNLSFENLIIGFIEITDADGNPVATLPDGTPSVEAIPIGPICFGNIGPCVEGEESCVSREFVISTRGAREGEYQIKFGPICFDVTFSLVEEGCFKFKLCKS